LLHHFPSRESLLVAALFRVLSDRVEGFVGAVQGPMAPETFIRTLWAQWQGDAYVAWLELAVASRTNPALREPLQDAMQGFDRLITDAFDALVPSTTLSAPLREQAPLLLFAMFNGLAVARIYEPEGRSEPRIESISAVVNAVIPNNVGVKTASHPHRQRND